MSTIDSINQEAEDDWFSVAVILIYGVPIDIEGVDLFDFTKVRSDIPDKEGTVLVKLRKHTDHSLHDQGRHYLLCTFTNMALGPCLYYQRLGSNEFKTIIKDVWYAAQKGGSDKITDYLKVLNRSKDYRSFALHSLSILKQYDIRTVCFVADNAEALQDGITFQNSTDEQRQELLSFQPTIPLSLRCHNHLLHLAWGDVKYHAPHLSTILESMHKLIQAFPSELQTLIGSKPHKVSQTRWLDEYGPVCWFTKHYHRFPTLSDSERQFFKELEFVKGILEPLWILKNHFSRRDCTISDVFLLLSIAVKTILTNADSMVSDRWKSISQLTIDCLFVRFFCSSSAPFMLFSAALTKLGRDSIYMNKPIVDFDIKLTEIPEPASISESESSNEIIEVTSDDDYSSSSQQSMRTKTAKRQPKNGIR
ncbi:hypothetical protein BLNAU_20973 [Blattamonas nauphoetae]|uniref:Uncharacterized protein n=1 Tax=Blattamonas nauphoetae TaxID=2049346 RepID=A0ABQ9X0J1_9EUKA|nr:hypothetical protein BLNAU_20973 [Blattamonas nauphoetae]